MDDRIITNEEIKEDSFEASIRPDTLEEYVGQEEAKEMLDVYKEYNKIKEW